jgi:hypothetical protein
MANFYYGLFHVGNENQDTPFNPSGQRIKVVEIWIFQQDTLKDGTGDALLVFDHQGRGTGAVFMLAVWTLRKS